MADQFSLALDRAQLLSPYRGGPPGSLGLSDFLRRQYRHNAWPDRRSPKPAVANSTKSSSGYAAHGQQGRC